MKRRLRKQTPFVFVGGTLSGGRERRLPLNAFVARWFVARGGAFVGQAEFGDLSMKVLGEFAQLQAGRGGLVRGGGGLGDNLRNLIEVAAEFFSSGRLLVGGGGDLRGHGVD